MINRHAAAPWVNGRLAPYLGAFRPSSLAMALPDLGLIGARGTAEPVPWGWSDTGRTLIMTVALGACAAVGSLLFRLLVSFVFLAGEAIGIVPAGSYDHFTAALAPYGAALTTLVITGGLYAGLIYSVFRHSVLKYRLPLSALGFRQMRRSSIARVAALFVPITIVGMIISGSQHLLFGAAQSNPQIDTLTRGVTPSAANFGMLALLLVVIAPLAEEVFFRGFLYRLLRQRLPVWASVGISATAFAGLHGAPALFPWLLFMGIVFGLVVEKTGSIYSSVLLHAMTNGLALIGIMALLSGW